MSPIQEACQQLERDRRFQAFMDWARGATLQGMLWHLEHLDRGQTDPVYRISEEMRAVFEHDKASSVLLLIAQVQKEKEAKAA